MIMESSRHTSLMRWYKEQQCHAVIVVVSCLHHKGSGNSLDVRFSSYAQRGIVTAFLTIISRMYANLSKDIKPQFHLLFKLQISLIFILFFLNPKAKGRSSTYWKRAILEFTAISSNYIVFFFCLRLYFYITYLLSAAVHDTIQKLHQTSMLVQYKPPFTCKVEDFLHSIQRNVPSTLTVQKTARGGPHASKFNPVRRLKDTYSVNSEIRGLRRVDQIDTS